MIKLRIRTAGFLLLAACLGVATQASATTFFYTSNNVFFDDGARAFGQIGLNVDADQYVGSQINILRGLSLVFQASDRTNDETSNPPGKFYTWTDYISFGPPSIADRLNFVFAKPLDLPACIGAITATCIGNGEHIAILSGFYADNSLFGAPQHFLITNPSAFVTAVNVAEPSALGLLGIAIAGLAFARRRRPA